MTIAFQHHHAAMLLKYSGISFISGAVNHGFFSGERSLWTASVGVLLFVLGAAMEHRYTDRHAEPDRAGLLRTLALGALLSIGLGVFTGGLQHFPDSPARSAWVVPLGFVISVPALAWSASHPWRRSTSVYVLLATVLVTASSYGAWQWLQRNPQWAAGGHSHAHGETLGNTSGDAHGPAPAQDMTALVVERSIEVRMDDRMRFTPEQIEVKAGETVRFVVHNAGQVAHEMVLGSDADISAHAQAMRQAQANGAAAADGHHDGHGDGHSHGTGAAITVPAGQKGELVVRFGPSSVAQTWQIACLIPGHYEAGMRGALRIAPSPAQAAAKPAAAHDHGTHKH